MNNSGTIKVYNSAGGFSDYLKMTRHPDKTDFAEISICLRSVDINMLYYSDPSVMF